MLQTRVVSGPDWAAELQVPWQQLASQSASATPFQTWEWHSTWWKHYGGGKRPYVLIVEEGDDLVGLYPLVRTRGPWSVLRAMGSGPADYLHPLVRTGFEERVGAEIADYLKRGKHASLIDLHQVREDKPGHDVFGADLPPLEQATCLVLDLPEGYEAYLGILSKSLRYDVRKLDKALFTEKRAEIRSVDRDGISEGLQVLFEQHQKRWRKRGLPGVFFGRAKRFQEEWAPLALDRGWLWLSTLHLENNPVGAIYAMRFGDCCYYYQAGFDPAASSISPGTLLVANTIKRAISEGCIRFDFLRGDEPYKRRWKPQHEYKNYRFLLPSPGVRGEAGKRWNEIALGLETKLRARLEGRGLF